MKSWSARRTSADTRKNSCVSASGCSMAALVGTGLSPRESAEKLVITEETARMVLKRVFSKTGVSRQSELVALLTKLVLR